MSRLEEESGDGVCKGAVVGVLVSDGAAEVEAPEGTATEAGRQSKSGTANGSKVDVRSRFKAGAEREEKS